VACGAAHLAAKAGKARPELSSLVAGREKDATDWRAALKRDPAFAAPEARLWELHALRRHYHPSCRAFSESLAANPTRQPAYAGDPLVDFALQKFLDRFAYRRPSGALARWS